MSSDSFATNALGPNIETFETKVNKQGELGAFLTNKFEEDEGTQLDVKRQLHKPF